MPKILVADDNANIQKMVSLSFEDRGIEVVTVGNGEAAVRRIPDVKPDLVLADIFMPVRNGYEVCEFVKKDERFSHVPVILLVGAFDPLDEKEARRVGADGVLKKPFVPPDPLIAMVMSALEKNPQIAAELARMREAKQAPPPPPVEAIPEPATSVRAELKPLPEFPEPSPEEAALIYGFGPGKRGTDEIAPQTLSEPKPPVGEPQEEEEEFESSSTRRDWRRNAMEIEIPAEAANQPAFDQLETAMFPSEREVPPKRVTVPEISGVSQPMTEHEAPSPVMDRAKEALIEPPVEASQNNSESSFFAPAEEPFVAQIESAPAARFATELRSEMAIEPESQNNDAEQPASAHWMDSLAQSSSDGSPTDWMSALYEQTAQKEAEAAAQIPSPEPQVVAAPAGGLSAGVDTAGLPMSAQSEAESEIGPPADLSVEQPSDGSAENHESSGETFFADDAETAPSVMNDSWRSAPVSAPEQAPLPIEEPVEATSAGAVPLAASGAEEGLETENASEPPFEFKDPDLVQPPAVHVTPEPLLVEDEPQRESQYGQAERQELQPLHSFFVSEAETHAGAEPNRVESSSADAPSIFGPAPERVNGLIPTGPPPNREALSEIPFLTPPPDFHAPSPEHAAASPETVDAVVRKVLEKIEPQLHDLLSQGVLKPLVENLLQGELAKKEK